LDSESTEWIAALCANQHSTVTNVKPEPAELCVCVLCVWRSCTWGGWHTHVC
jgi:hypothetical protein